MNSICKVYRIVSHVTHLKYITTCCRSQMCIIADMEITSLYLLINSKFE